MGWKLKAFAVLLALSFLAATLWQLSLVIFAALIVPPLLRRSARREPKERRGGGRFPFRLATGALLIMLSLVALAAGGTLSPIVFGGPGLLLLVWRGVPALPMGGSLKPVKDSILMRRGLVPFRWTAVFEVKPVTRDPARALSGIAEPIMIGASGTPSIHVAITRTALGERSAEGRILREAERIGGGIVAHGAYLLPLSSKQAASLLEVPLEPEAVSEEGWPLSLSTSSYDVLTINAAEGFVKGLGLFRTARSGPSNPRLPRETLRFSRSPLLWEVFKSLDGRVQWPSPDRYTAFLSSLFATVHDSIGSSITDAGTASPTSDTVLVRSHSSPTVELTRAQLRAIVGMYSRASRMPEVSPPVMVQEPVSAH